MREPPFIVAVPSDRYFVDDHCANCLDPIPDEIEALFCSTWCKEVAENVRYLRSVVRDGRIEDPLVRQAISTKQAFLLIGGYGSLDRTLTLAVRAEVKVRDQGRCQSCGKPGTDIDHIAGSSNDPSNLQLLCGECHHSKTAENLVPASPESSALLQALFLTRVVPDAPTLLADDEVMWQTSWRGLKKGRKERFITLLEAEGLHVKDLKSRAEMVLVRDENFADLLDTGPRTADDDSGFGSGSYFERSMQKDD